MELKGMGWMMCSISTYDVGSDGDAGYSDANHEAKSNVDIEVGGESSTHTEQELKGQWE